MCSERMRYRCRMGVWGRLCGSRSYKKHHSTTILLLLLRPRRYLVRHEGCSIGGICAVRSPCCTVTVVTSTRPSSLGLYYIGTRGPVIDDRLSPMSRLARRIDTRYAYRTLHKDRGMGPINVVYTCIYIEIST